MRKPSTWFPRLDCLLNSNHVGYLGIYQDGLKFLVGRKQILINGETFSWCNVLSGVPQGSVLGPLLLNIHVNDILVQINSPVLQFANDFKMLCAFHNVEDLHQLQNDINKLLTRAKKQLLKFNIPKCYLLHLGT